MKITQEGIAVVDGDSHLSKWIAEQRRLDVAADYCRLFDKYIPKNGVVFDVGACLGDHTLTYAQMVGAMGKVLAFEANPTAFECLAYNLRHCGQVDCLNVALGADFGRGEIVPNTDEPLNLGAFQMRKRTSGRILIDTLDHYSKDLKRVDFIKIDAEGDELEILLGAEATIWKFHPVMLIEINRPLLTKSCQTAESIFAFLNWRGYSIQPSEPHISMDAPQLDILALRT